jgi:hypothetical protein
MTDEPDKSGKPIKAALVLFSLLLSALALLAGCKSEPQKASFLRIDDNGVQFVKWTQEGMRIRGTIDMSEMKPGGEIVTALATFDGVLDGENFRMTTTSARSSERGDEEAGEKITGRLKWDTLTLLIDEKGSEPKEFRRATHAEYAEASRKLQMRSKLNKGAF